VVIFSLLSLLFKIVKSIDGSSCLFAAFPSVNEGKTVV
jgi:hypothetical protein